MTSIKSLRDRRAKVIDDGRAVVAGYADRDDGPTEDEINKVKSLAAERDALDKQIDEAAKLQDIARDFAPDESVALTSNTVSITGGRERMEDDPARGFKHFGEFCKSVYHASRSGNTGDRRLFVGAAPTSYGNETTGADGTFAIPPAFGAMQELMLEQDSLLALTDTDPVTGNTMSFPADETTPWGTTGVRTYWEAEASQATQTKPSLKLKNMRLYKLFGLVGMTDELLSDAATMGSYVERKAAIDIRYKTNDAIVNGTGAGQPLGIMTAASTVSQAKEGSQTAATINATNVAKMYSRVIGPQSGTWLINPDAYNQLVVMTIGDQPVWTAPTQGMANAPGGLLMGRPVVFSDTCATLGTVGDIIFGNFNGYKTITKAGGIQTATSIGLWFDYDIMAFRATFRVDGSPWLSAAVSPAKGSVTRSHFCTLATRS